MVKSCGLLLYEFVKKLFGRDEVAMHQKENDGKLQVGCCFRMS